MATTIALRSGRERAVGWSKWGDAYARSDCRCSPASRVPAPGAAALAGIEDVSIRHVGLDAPDASSSSEEAPRLVPRRQSLAPGRPGAPQRSTGVGRVVLPAERRSPFNSPMDTCFMMRLACESLGVEGRQRACENGPRRRPGPSEPARMSVGCCVLLGRRDDVGRREEPPRHESGFRAQGSNQRFHRLLRHAVARALTTAPSLAGVSPAAQTFSSLIGGGARGPPGTLLHKPLNVLVHQLGGGSHV
jgi:hypothetical protein